MATTQDNNDRNYSDAENLERARVSRLILPAWIVELEQAAVNPISIAPKSISVGPPGSLSTGGVVADVSDIHMIRPHAGTFQTGVSKGVGTSIVINQVK